MIALQLLSIPLFVVFGLIFWGIGILLGNRATTVTFGVGEIGLIFIPVILTFILHELTHGLLMTLFGAKPTYGILWKKAVFYATTPGFAYRRNHYIQIALAPLFILSALAILGMWSLNGTFGLAIFGICGVINASGAIGDMWMTIILLRYPATAYVMDERDGIRVFLPKAGLAKNIVDPHSKTTKLPVQQYTK